jgi:hypothetical protein
LARIDRIMGLRPFVEIPAIFTRRELLDVVASLDGCKVIAGRRKFAWKERGSRSK